MTAHDLHNDDHAGVVHVRVLIHLGAGGGDILRRAAEAGAVVGVVKVVVDGLGNAHDPALVARLLHKAADLVTGIHRVVAAVVEEVADVVLLEYLQNALVVRIVLLRVSHFVAARTQLRRRSVHEQAKLVSVLLTHVVELVLQHTFDPVRCTVDLCDAVRIQRSPDNAVGAGVDN